MDTIKLLLFIIAIIGHKNKRTNKKTKEKQRENEEQN